MYVVYVELIIDINSRRIHPCIKNIYNKRTTNIDKIRNVLIWFGKISRRLYMLNLNEIAFEMITGNNFDIFRPALKTTRALFILDFNISFCCHHDLFSILYYLFPFYRSLQYPASSFFFVLRVPS